MRGVDASFWSKTMIIMGKPIPRKGSKILSLNDLQFRWIAYATPKGTEVRVEYEAVISGQMLIAQVPKVFDRRWVEEIINFGLDNGWDPWEEGEDLVIRRTRNGYRVIEE